MKLGSFPQETSWSSVNQNFLLRGICYQLDSLFLIRVIGLLMSLWSERCFIVASWQTQHPSIKKNKKNEKIMHSKTDLPDRIDLWSDRTQTMFQTKKTMIRPSRPNWPLIRPKSDHGLDYCALEPLSRPYNFGLGTQGCALDWVWS